MGLDNLDDLFEKTKHWELRMKGCHYVVGYLFYSFSRFLLMFNQQFKQFDSIFIFNGGHCPSRDTASVNN